MNRAPLSIGALSARWRTRLSVAAAGVKRLAANLASPRAIRGGVADRAGLIPASIAAEHARGGGFLFAAGDVINHPGARLARCSMGVHAERVDRRLQLG